MSLVLRGTNVPFEARSDGYRAFAGLITDLVCHLADCTPAKHKMADMRGLVLIDEIDLHLHPEWQREVLTRISKTFPLLQFVVTSHSPIVTGTLTHRNIYLMDVLEDGSSSVGQSEERVHGLSADQLLTGSYFGLASTRAEAFETRLEALAKKAAKGDEVASLQFIRQLTGASDAETQKDESEAPRKTAKKKVKRTKKSAKKRR